MTKPSKQQLINDRKAILAADGTLASKLAPWSRDVLTYVMDSGDIDMVQRMIDGLSPVYAKQACSYFPRFLPWEWDKDARKFGKKDTKKVKAKTAALEKFLADPANNMISLAKQAKSEADKTKNPKHAEKLGKLLEKGLKEENPEFRLTTAEIFSTLKSTGVSWDELLPMVFEMASDDVKAGLAEK